MQAPDRAAIEATQLEQLRTLIAKTLDANAFYGAKLRAAGVTAPPESIEEFCRTVPLTAKQEYVDDQQRHPPHGTNFAYPPADYTRLHSTSGTTGAPLRWLDTTESWTWAYQGWKRVFDAHGITRGDRIFFPFSFGPFCGFWLAWDAAIEMGAMAIPGGGIRTPVRLQMIVDNQATVVCATPTYAIRLGEAAREEGVDLGASSVRAVVVAGEPGGSVPSTRKLLESLWPGARIIDHHGMTEVGPVTYECPERPGLLHVIETQYLAEVIDPVTEEPVSPGGEGELILTTLGRLASPAIRYRTRDTVKLAAAPQCVCGSREMTLEGGIIGRADDMVVVRGINIYPSAVEQVLRADGAVDEFRVEIRDDRGMYDVAVYVEPSDDGQAEPLERRLSDAFVKAFGMRFSVACVERGKLPRFEAKARRWIRVQGA